ncbi:MAG: hypothetical protein KG012_19960 [Deltaproteobacteria bacterium]|nr:hypothetical protein [Deltaproteobacteria bacterium]
MRKGMIYRSFIYFLSISFLLLVNGFPGMVAGAREIKLPIGEMISRGDVKYEARENVWKKVETSHFPVFQGVKIKTERGAAAIALANTGQIEVGPNSLFYFDQMDRFVLSEGNIQFLIPSGSEVNFKVGNISILKSRVLRASRTPASTAPKSEETIGSISIHSNGAVTIKNIQGNLSVLDENRVLLAGLSSKDSVTLPSTTVKTSPRMMTAQVGQTTGAAAATTGEFLGLSTWAWVGIIAGAAAIGGIAWAISEADEKDRRPICP